MFSLHISLYATKRGLTAGLEVPKAKHICSCRTRGKMWSYRNSEKASLLKSSLHFTTFNLVITHLTCSIYSLEGEASVPLDTVILFWMLSGTQRDTWNIRRKATLLFKERKAQKMLSLCEKLYIKQDRNPKCSRKDFWVTGGISKGGREAFHIKGCCDVLSPVLEILKPAFKYINCCYTLIAEQIPD